MKFQVQFVYKNLLKSISLVEMQELDFAVGNEFGTKFGTKSGTKSIVNWQQISELLSMAKKPVR